MFDIGAPELLVVAIVLIVVVGPKDLPKMLRTFGKTTSKLRAMAGDFRKQFDDALKEAELDDVKDAVSSVRKFNPLDTVRKELNPLSSAGKDIKDEVEKAIKPDDLKVMDPPTVASGTAPATPAGPAKGAVTGDAASARTPAAKRAPAKKPAAKTPAAKAAAKPAAKTTTKAAAKPAAAKTAAKTAKTKPKAAGAKKGAKA